MKYIQIKNSIAQKMQQYPSFVAFSFGCNGSSGSDIPEQSGIRMISFCGNRDLL